MLLYCWILAANLLSWHHTNASMILSSTVYRSSRTISIAKTTAGKLLVRRNKQPFKRNKMQQRSLLHSSTITMMPEGPEVRSLIDQLQPAVGQRLVNVQSVSGRYVKNLPEGFEAFADTMTEKQPEPMDWYEKMMNEPDEENIAVDIITEWNCKGKFIYIILDNGSATTTNPDFQRSIWITLGMTGQFMSEKAVQERDEAGKASHVRWYLELMKVNNTTTDDTSTPDNEQNAVDKSKTTKIYYSDVRNFGTLKFCLSKQALVEKLERLGPDILSSCTEQDFINVIAEYRDQDKNICKFLMDQSNICGVGNYILAEGLYRANIDPFAAISELNLTQQQDLFRELRAVATESYRLQTDDSLGIFEYQCYGQKHCKQRGDPVHRVRGKHGRSIWYTDRQLFMPRQKREQHPLQSNVQTRSASRTAATGATRKRAAVAEAMTPGNAKLAAILSGNSVETSSRASSDSSSSASVKNGALDGLSLALSLIAGITDQGWNDALCDTILSSKSFQELAVFLEEERLRGATIYPPRNEIFAALDLCPLSSVKVVVLGQDPFHAPGQGHGLAFSVRKGVRPPPSLQNIFKEAMEDVGIEAPSHGNLEYWAKQGVLLLNAVLTVRQGEANSHAGKGWEEVTDAIIQQVCVKKENENDGGVVFLLWGNFAMKKVGKVIDSDSHHTIIQTSHPSPLGATRTASPFLGSKCFSRANKALVEMGKDPIDWNVDP